MIRIETQICDRLHRLKNYINSRVGKGAVADDLYGDAVLKILKKAKRSKNGSSLNTFMWRCAQTVISDYFKKENVHKRLLDTEYVYRINTIGKSPEKEYEIREENKKFMEKAKKELNDIRRRVLILLLFQNMRHYEIADTLGIARETVSSHLMRMRSELGDVHLGKYREFKKEKHGLTDR